MRSGDALPAGVKPFKYSHKGSLAYVGSDKAVMDVPAVGPIFGWGAGAPGRPPPRACCRMAGPAAGRPPVRCLLCVHAGCSMDGRVQAQRGCYYVRSAGAAFAMARMWGPGVCRCGLGEASRIDRSPEH